LTNKSQETSRKRRWTQRIIIAGIIVAVLALSAVYFVRRTYQANLGSVSNSQNIQLIVIPTGATVSEIATRLHKAGLIRKTWAFEWYVRSQEARDKLKAGTYALSPNQSVPDIVDILSKGEVATKLVTILPGKRLDQIRAQLINNGFSPDDVDAALKPEQYANHPALVDKPASASLEGYLYPESFQKDSNTSAKQIVAASLDEMQKRLTPELRNQVSKQGLSMYEAITLASVIEREVGKPEDRRIVAQVLLKRLQGGMKLESDPTAYYGAILAGKDPSLTFDSPYNTYLHAGLPPGPISNVTDSALQAVANPAPTDYLFFVSGDDGKTYFSHTLAEHQTLAREHCKQKCAQ
jgi:UPF0755 protein